jgi:hypothetical protein
MCEFHLTNDDMGDNLAKLFQRNNLAKLTIIGGIGGQKFS